MSKVSFNRWLLAYTLMKNPQLQELRGHCIAAKKADEQMVAAKVDNKEMEVLNEETNPELRLVNIDKESVVDIEMETSTQEINNNESNCELQVVKIEEESVVDDKL